MTGPVDHWDAIDWPRLAERIALAQHHAVNAPDRQGSGFEVTGRALRDVLAAAGSGVISRGEASHLAERAAHDQRLAREAAERTSSKLMAEADTAVADALDGLAEGLTDLARRTSTKYRAEGVRIAAGVVADEARKRRTSSMRAELRRSRPACRSGSTPAEVNP